MEKNTYLIVKLTDSKFLVSDLGGSELEKRMV